MKYIRHNINFRSVGPKARVMLLFFVVLPAMAILGAGIINRLIVTPYLSEQVKASETNMAAPSGGTYSFYLLQAGVFSSGDNAKNMASQIRAAGFKAYSIKDGEVYRIVAGAAAEKSSLQQYGTSLQQAGYITLCKPIEMNEASLAGSPVGTKEYISAAGELINTMLEYASSPYKLDSVKIETLESYASAIRKQYDSIEEEAGEKAREFNASLLVALQEYIGEADNLDRRTEITWGCIASYGRMAEEIKK